MLVNLKLFEKPLPNKLILFIGTSGVPNLDSPKTARPKRDGSNIEPTSNVAGWETPASSKSYLTSKSMSVVPSGLIDNLVKCNVFLIPISP